MTAAPSDHRVLSRGLTGTLRGSLYAAAATSLASVVTTYREIERFDAYTGSPSPSSLVRLVAAEEASQAMTGLFSVAGIVVAVLIVMWWYQAYRSLERAALVGRSWSSGWAIGGWFIPFANLVVPKLVLNEIDRGSAALDEGDPFWRDRRRSPVADWWWALWVVASAALAVGMSPIPAQVERELLDPATYRFGLWVLGVGMAAACGAAFCGAAAIRVIGSRLIPPR